jgi:endonuclease G
MRPPSRCLTLALVLLLVAGCGPPPGGGGDPAAPKGSEPQAGAAEETEGGRASRAGNPNVRFGLPAPAKADPEGSREAFLLRRPQYVLSYNAKTRTPNQVCWRLRAEDIGTTPRSAFEPDPALPKGLIACVTSHDYDGAGFDRGHMCPAKDRSATPEDSRAVFYMTNIVPQSPASSQKGWERLEDYCRRLAKEGKVLYIACGPHGQGGAGKNGPAEEVGKGRKITVPHALWKVVPVLPDEAAEPRRNSRVFAIVMPNNQTVGLDWTKYRTTARKVESLTGFRFFRNIDPETAEALRDHLDRVEVRAKAGRRKRGGGEE